MMDPKLAKGFARRLLRDLKKPSSVADAAIRKLPDNFGASPKGQKRKLQRLLKEHDAVIGIIGGSISDIEIVLWVRSGMGVTNTDYKEESVLATVTTSIRRTRQETDLSTCVGPLTFSGHALQRWIERDLTLPDYNFKEWMHRLGPMLLTVRALFGMIYESENRLASLYRPVALPTTGGLFVAFMVPATDQSGQTEGWSVAARSFYGQHELDPDQQKLHTSLMEALDVDRDDEIEVVIAAHEAYGWDRLWAGQEPGLLRAMKGANH